MRVPDQIASASTRPGITSGTTSDSRENRPPPVADVLVRRGCRPAVIRRTPQFPPASPNVVPRPTGCTPGSRRGVRRAHRQRVAAAHPARLQLRLVVTRQSRTREPSPGRRVQAAARTPRAAGDLGAGGLAAASRSASTVGHLKASTAHTIWVQANDPPVAVPGKLPPRCELLTTSGRRTRTPVEYCTRTRRDPPRGEAARAVHPSARQPSSAARAVKRARPAAGQLACSPCGHASPALP